jgi:AcrR family transcriptional regulator
MPRTKEQNMAIRAEKKQIIMDAALLLFAENGYERTSIGNIAKHAGISQGLVYSYFKNKDDLLYRILDSGMKTFVENFCTEMSMEEFITNVEKSFTHIVENSDFYKLYTVISVQYKVTQRLGTLVNEYDSVQNHLANWFGEHFGEHATQELLLLSVIMKGFTVLSVFSDQQKVLSVDTLKKTVMDFIRERYLG